MSERDTYKYELKERNKLLYVGITDNPKRREAEHRCTKDFSNMKVVGRAVTRESAEKWETERINQYRRNHKGQFPPLNKTCNGK